MDKKMNTMEIKDSLQKALQAKDNITIGDAICTIIESDGFTLHQDLGNEEYSIRVSVPSKSANDGYLQQINLIIQNIEWLINEGQIVLTDKDEQYGTQIKMGRLKRYDEEYKSCLLCKDNDHKVWDILSSHFRIAS